MNIKIDGEDVYFHDGYTYYYFDKIALKEINKTKIINFKAHSYWIEKFYKHPDFDYASIYKFVEFINKEFPENNINWTSQLYNIECYHNLLEIESAKNVLIQSTQRKSFTASKKNIDSWATELAKDKIKLVKIEMKVITQLIKYNLFINKYTLTL
jgi:hypothetical protein